MADTWIKMRGSLVDHPKVIATARALMDRPDFRNWIGFTSPDIRHEIVTRISRHVVTTLLLRVWSTGRETGKFVGEDLHLAHSTVADLDQFGGAPGLGEAMQRVGWAVEREGQNGIFFPNFKEFNVPKTDAERARDYRKRGVTGSSRRERDEKGENVTPRGREEGYISPTSSKTTPTSTSKAKPPSGRGLNGKGDEARRVLAFLNEKVGKAFHPTGANLELIAARLREGYTEGQCRQVVVRKAREWAEDDKMAQYLRPATLFNREKFNQYAGELVVALGEIEGGSNG